MNKLSGKVALVTGTSKGIGASIAEHLAAEGASVVVNYASSKSARTLSSLELLRRGRKAIVVQEDVSQPEDIHRLFSETKSRGANKPLCSQEPKKLTGLHRLHHQKEQIIKTGTERKACGHKYPHASNVLFLTTLVRSQVWL